VGNDDQQRAEVVPRAERVDVVRWTLGVVLVLTLLGASGAPPSLSVPGIDEALDLHGNPCDAQLVLFVGGNQWMAMPALLSAFERLHPGLSRVFYETLPPGILARQLRAGSIQIGSLSINVTPDVFMVGKRRMADVLSDGLVQQPTTYATNVLAIAVRAGNPKHIESLEDLGRSDVRVAMPNPTWEGIARQIESAYRKAGGERLVNTIMVTKGRDGTTLLTQIHHRETPMWLIDGRVDAGPVWITEALYQQRIGAPIETVRIPSSQNERGSYEAAAVAKAPHPQLAHDFVLFLTTPQAQEIYRSYGFGSPALTTAE
jgi:molybdate transport system substrate-binding protein